MPPKKSDIFVCPLDWGIGHASRCIPVIRELLALGASVTIGGSGYALGLLRNAFPDLPFILFPGITVTYPKTGSMAWKMATQFPAILRAISQEHRELDRLVDEIHFGAVISDNRFGLWNKRVKTAYITHQLRIKAPKALKYAEPWLARIHRSYISRFDECWIPDFPDIPNLSGDLSHSLPIPSNATFIGPLSRFNMEGEPVAPGAFPKPDLLVLLSGPEPQRTRFEEIIMSQAESIRGFSVVVARGLPGSQDPPVRNGDITAYAHLSDQILRPLILGAGRILCRSGYSTIMDLACLGRSAVLVPTPGQTEQEYLARHLSIMKGFEMIPQTAIDLKAIVTSSKGGPGGSSMKPNAFHQEKLVAVLKDFLRKL